jgi:hypothetical protein
LKQTQLLVRSNLSQVSYSQTWLFSLLFHCGGPQNHRARKADLGESLHSQATAWIVISLSFPLYYQIRHIIWSPATICEVCQDAIWWLSRDSEFGKFLCNPSIPLPTSPCL